MSALILLTVSMLTVVAVDAGSLDASFAGFALSLALGIVGMLSFMVRVWAELENAMNASERITYDDACLPPHLLPACGCLTPSFAGTTPTTRLPRQQMSSRTHPLAVLSPLQSGRSVAPSLSRT